MRLHFSILLIVVSVRSYSQSENQNDRIDSLLHSYHEYDHLNGNVLVSEHGKVTYHRSFGKANFEWDIENTTDARFRVASITKVFTAVLTFVLCQEEKLNLDHRISRYLPEFPNGDQITIDHLLTHRSGIIDHRNLRNSYDNMYGMSRLTRDQMLNIFKDSALLFEPGSAWRYSNFGYNVLGVIIEKVTGRSFCEVLNEKVFAPMGMNQSTTMETSQLIPKLTSGYESAFAGVVHAQYFDASMMLASGNIISTTGDLHLFLNGIRNGRLLNSFYREKLYSHPFKDESGSKTGYNTWLFPQKTGRDSVEVMYFAGNHFGSHALVYDSFKDDKVVILLLNARSQKLFEIADNILNVLYDQPFEWPKDSYVRWLAKDIGRWGVETAVDRFRRNKKQYGDLWTHRPRDLNRLGYYFMDRNEPRIAVEIFKLNLEYFPEEGDFYDSLGEAFLRLGEKKKAIENLKKALKLNPNNTHARDLLRSANSD